MNWIDEEIELYDFVWKEAMQMCGIHGNETLAKDFQTGGTLFEDMKAKIAETWPTREDAIKALNHQHDI